MLNMTNTTRTVTLKLTRSQRELTLKHLQEIEQIIHDPAAIKLELIAPSLEILPKEIAQIQNLTFLNLTIGPIEAEHWPDLLWSHSKLNRLNIVAQSGIELPQQIQQKITPLPSLEYLTLKNSGLSKLPSWLYQLKALKEVLINGAKLTELDSNIQNWSKLSRLSLDRNQIEKFPEEFYQLNKLVHLSLDGNPLSEQTKQKIYERWKIFID